MIAIVGEAMSSLRAEAHNKSWVTVGEHDSKGELLWQCVRARNFKRTTAELLMRM